jgi:hypothetical protein
MNNPKQLGKYNDNFAITTELKKLLEMIEVPREQLNREQSSYT